MSLLLLFTGTGQTGLDLSNPKPEVSNLFYLFRRMQFEQELALEKKQISQQKQIYEGDSPALYDRHYELFMKHDSSE